MTLPLGYAVLTILTLFVGSGGDFEVAKSRLTWIPWIYVILSVLLGVLEQTLQKKLLWFRFERVREALMWGLGLGAVGVLTVGLHRSGFAIPGITSSLGHLSESAKSLTPAAGVSVVAGFVAMAVGLELYSRTFLAPQWGFWSVAFLDALAFGFGFQSWILFVWFFLIPGFLGWRRLPGPEAATAHGLALALTATALLIGT